VSRCPNKRYLMDKILTFYRRLNDTEIAEVVDLEISKK
jgi:hypothetical protein